jgi:uncharacterized protein DUF4193
MRTAERRREPSEAHYTEGELDLEPPEELAIGELGEEAILEEELDNEDLLEQDVDEDTLEETLEDLVHAGDDEVDEDDEENSGALLLALGTPITLDPGASGGPSDSEDELGSEDLEESLDLVLLERMALVGDEGELEDEEEGNALVEHSLLLQMQSDNADLVEVAPCGSDEFVCQSCFLVRRRVQLVDHVAMSCHDCST